MIPGPFELWRDTFTLRRSASHVTSRSALGLIRSAVTDAEVAAVSYWSRAEASSARQGVSLVQARSVLPGEYDEHNVCMACCLPRVTAEASVMRRCAREPSGSAAGSSGALVAHQIATGESGSRSGSTTESACLTTSPRSRIRAVSPVQPARVPTWAWTWEAPRASPRMTPSERAGCSWAAILAEVIAWSACSSSTTTIRVSTMPMAGLPALRRSLTNAEAIADAVVLVSSIIRASSRAGRRAPASRWRTPGPSRRRGTARDDRPCAPSSR